MLPTLKARCAEMACRGLREAVAKSEKQIARGPKPARDDKTKGLSARLKSCPDTKLLAREFFSTP